MKYHLSATESCGEHRTILSLFLSSFSSLSQHHGISIIPVEEIDIPFLDLRAKEHTIKHFSASALIFLFDLNEPLFPHTYFSVIGLYSAKARKATTRRTRGPSQGISDKNIMSTAKRETEEEVNLHASRGASLVYSDCLVYSDSWIHKGVPILRYTFSLEVREQLKLDRT